MANRTTNPAISVGTQIHWTCHGTGEQFNPSEYSVSFTVEYATRFINRSKAKAFAAAMLKETRAFIQWLKKSR